MGFLSGGKVIVGYDLGNEFSQISYSFSDSGEVETLSQVAGTEHYNIPTVLCKRSGVNQWFYGKEALRYGAEQQGIQVDHLLDLALDGEPVLIDGESLDPVALLTLFFKRSLGMLSQVASPDKIEALMITCETLDQRMLEVLGQVVAGLRLKTDKIAFQSHMESYYNYMIYQPEDLRVYQSVLLTRERDSIRMYRMENNRRTTPIVVFIEEGEFPFPRQRFTEQPEGSEEGEKRELDGALLKIAEEVCEGRLVGSVFLIGDGFDQEWMKESLRYLCKKRRVFQGNNLFSKGAVFGMRERLNAGNAGSGGREYVFLSRDKLKANIGMEILRQGEESYYALLDAGSNWYEAETETEFYVQDGKELQLTITPLNGQNVKLARVVLEDMPETLTRLWGRFYMEAENILAVEIEDEGLGEIRPATGKVWKETIELY
ncbi:MAG: DUF5716 family protein [Butyrivibrio sp.]|nr:DUF5716 family protein [Acetatifactor muris]MCM1558798.1 DUF5716 family protein [Butyrivibrio sp.]